jgi:bifunctional non-homologous end joining protein LigD
LARLTAYHRKRHFDVTSEPRGRVGPAAVKTRRFVIQRHDATRLHYDFRLELDGVYKSWAVTKVPSLDPTVRRLAVEVEDHPLEYGTFEGTIPKGQYGGGTVQLWDNGTWAPQSETPPSRDLAVGHLKMVLAGKRLKGGWALIRLRDRDEGRRRTPRHNWLLIKERDEEARDGDPDALLSETTSVKTGRTLEEIANRSRKVWQSNRAADDQPQAAAKRAPAKRPAAKRASAKRTPVKRAKAARPAKPKPARASKRKARQR